MRADLPRPSLAWRVFALGGIVTLGTLSTSDDAWDWWEENVTEAMPRRTVRFLFWGTVGVHVGEAVLMGRLARAAGVDHPESWARTTLLYGFPTFWALRQASALAPGETAS